VVRHDENRLGAAGSPRRATQPNPQYCPQQESHQSTHDVGFKALLAPKPAF
jgi:hypothetical protein